MRWKVGTGRLLKKAIEGRVPAAIDPTGVDRAETDPIVPVRIVPVPIVAGRIVIVEVAAIGVEPTATRLPAESPLLRQFVANSNQPRLAPPPKIALQRIVVGRTVPAKTDLAMIVPVEIALVGKRLP